MPLLYTPHRRFSLSCARSLRQYTFLTQQVSLAIMLFWLRGIEIWRGSSRRTSCYVTVYRCVIGLPLQALPVNVLGAVFEAGACKKLTFVYCILYTIDLFNQMPDYCLSQRWSARKLMQGSHEEVFMHPKLAFLTCDHTIISNAITGPVEVDKCNDINDRSNWKKSIHARSRLLRSVYTS